jgi:methyl-accepting chemotaxis protein
MPAKKAPKRTTTSRSKPTSKKRTTRTTSTTKSGSYVKFSDRLTDSLEDISKMIEEHKEMIDSIQDVALELTTAIGSLHTVTVKYAGKANQILDILLPIIKELPIIPKKVTDLLVDLEEWTQNIIDNEKKTSKTITDVRSGLHTGDISKLKGHSGDLKKVTKTITSIVPKT